MARRHPAADCGRRRARRNLSSLPQLSVPELGRRRGDRRQLESRPAARRQLGIYDDVDGALSASELAGVGRAEERFRTERRSISQRQPRGPCDLQSCSSGRWRAPSWLAPPAPARSATVLDAGATAAALLYGVHPLRVEVVAWISALPYSVALVFALATALVWLRASSSARLTPGVFRALALYAASLLARPVAVGLPVVLVVARHLAEPAKPARERRESVAVCGLAALAAAGELAARATGTQCDAVALQAAVSDIRAVRVFVADRCADCAHSTRRVAAPPCRKRRSGSYRDCWTARRVRRRLAGPPSLPCLRRRVGRLSGAAGSRCRPHPKRPAGDCRPLQLPAGSRRCDCDCGGGRPLE